MFYFSAYEVLLVLSYLKQHVFIKLITSFAAISNFYGFFSDKYQRLPSSSTFRNDVRCLNFHFRWGILSIKIKVSTLLCKLLSLCLRPNPRIDCCKRLKLQCRRSRLLLVRRSDMLWLSWLWVRSKAVQKNLLLPSLHIVSKFLFWTALLDVRSMNERKDETFRKKTF